MQLHDIMMTSNAFSMKYIYLEGMSYPSALCNYSFILVFIIRKRQYMNNGNLDSVSCDGFAEYEKCTLKWML